jgi:hypothetical protein
MHHRRPAASLNVRPTTIGRGSTRAETVLRHGWRREPSRSEISPRESARREEAGLIDEAPEAAATDWVEVIEEIDKRLGETHDRINLATAVVDTAGCDPSLLDGLIDHLTGEDAQCFGESPVSACQGVRQFDRSRNSPR